jgi:hypothetical protein
VIESQTIDFLVSHGQIVLRSRAFDETISRWGPVNIEQGAIIHPDYVIFDPLPEDAFGANVNIRLVNDFILSVDAQRCIVVPFEVIDNNEFVVASAMEAVKINLDLTSGMYSIYFEICEGREVYYNFSFVPADVPVASMYLMDDPWGGVKGKRIHCGNL